MNSESTAQLFALAREGVHTHTGDVELCPCGFSTADHEQMRKHKQKFHGNPEWRGDFNTPALRNEHTYTQPKESEGNGK